MILHEKTKLEFGYEFTTATIRSEFYCTCDYCGKEFTRCKKTIVQCNKVITKDSCGVGVCKRQKSEEVQMVKFGAKNVGGSAESIKKREATSLEKYGNEHFNRTEESKEFYRSKYGTDYPIQTEEVKQKAKDTRIEHYGVDHHTKSAEYQEQLKQKCMEKYGVEHFMATKEFIEKVKEVIKERYDVDHYSKTDEFKQKVKETCIERYGVEYPMLSDTVKQKFADTCFKKYGVSHFLSLPEIREKITAHFQEKHGTNSYFGTPEFKEYMKELWLEKYGNEVYFKTDDFKQKVKKTSLEKYGVIHYAKAQVVRDKMAKTCMEIYGTPYPSNCYGKAQKEVQEYLNGFGFNFNPDISLLGGKEIDLYDSSIKVGVEYCGLFWHNELSPQPRLRTYHYSKYRKCLEKGVRLITIFEDEWVNRKEQSKNVLLSILGKHVTKVHARDCDVAVVDKKVFKKFCEDNHIQGSCGSLIRYGLFHEGELIGGMSLGRHHRKPLEEGIVLNRLCFKGGVQIVAGAGRLLHYCTKWAKSNGYKSIISWSDNRWSSGQVYGKLGFLLEKELPPDYSYVDTSKPYVRVPKQLCKKSCTDCPQDKTEREWMLENGYSRIWDCGKLRWGKNLQGDAI
jgi:hypothetical protein